MASLMAAEIDSPWELPFTSSSQVELSKTQEDCTHKKSPTSIRVPDMFSSILSAEAVVNPHYLAVKEDGDRYFEEYVMTIGVELYHQTTTKLDRQSA